MIELTNRSCKDSLPPTRNQSRAPDTSTPQMSKSSTVTPKEQKGNRDWKIAHKARRAAQERWRVQRHEKAAEGQWQSFRYLKSQGGTEWTVHYVDMAEHEKQEPQRGTVEHFRKLFQCTEPRDPPRWDKAVDTGHCHVARAANRSKPPASSYMDSYRTLAWWKEQQRNGLTHPASFYPYHTREETALNNASQHHDWRQRAQDPCSMATAHAQVDFRYGCCMGIWKAACPPLLAGITTEPVQTPLFSHVV